MVRDSENCKQFLDEFQIKISVKFENLNESYLNYNISKYVYFYNYDFVKSSLKIFSYKVSKKTAIVFFPLSMELEQIK